MKSKQELKEMEISWLRNVLTTSSCFLMRSFDAADQIRLFQVTIVASVLH